MALCAYTTLFKLKLFNFYRLVPHQMSDAGSIMFSAKYVFLSFLLLLLLLLYIYFTISSFYYCYSLLTKLSYLCRLAAPLAYNFLTIVNVKDTNFLAVLYYF